MELFVNGWSALVFASPLFLIAAGLTLSVGASSTANLSLGALAMLGAYLARIVVAASPDPVWVALAFLVATGVPAAFAALLDVAILRRLREAPVLFPMLVTLGVALVIGSLIPSGPRLPARHWFAGEIGVAGEPVSIADAGRIAVGPVVFACLLVIRRTRWNAPLRRRTLSAAVGGGLAGLAGVLLAAWAPEGADLDAAGTWLLIGGILIAIVMQPVRLMLHGIERPLERVELVRSTPASIRLFGILALMVAATAPFVAEPSALALLSRTLTAILFAASLQMLLGPCSMPSLGHGAFFGIGAIAAAALSRDAGLAVALLAAPIAAGGAALVVGTLLVWLPGVIVAMLTLAFGQLALTQLGSGWIGALPSARWAGDPALLYWLTLFLCIGGTLLLRRALSGPFGYALRASRDDPRRAVAIGIPIHAVRLAAFVIAGSMAGLAGGLAGAGAGDGLVDLGGNGSLDGVLMVMLGGMQTLSGPIVGALAVTGLRDAAEALGIAWGPALGVALIAGVILLPAGVAGWSIRRWRRGAA